MRCLQHDLIHFSRSIPVSAIGKQFETLCFDTTKELHIEGVDSAVVLRFCRLQNHVHAPPGFCACVIRAVILNVKLHGHVDSLVEGMLALGFYHRQAVMKALAEACDACVSSGHVRTTRKYCNSSKDMHTYMRTPVKGANMLPENGTYAEGANMLPEKCAYADGKNTNSSSDVLDHKMSNRNVCGDKRTDSNLFPEGAEILKYRTLCAILTKYLPRRIDCLEESTEAESMRFIVSILSLRDDSVTRVLVSSMECVDSTSKCISLLR